MLDKLKEHIDHHREGFELYPFDQESGWSELAGKVAPKSEQQPVWKWLAIASCVLLVAWGSLHLYRPLQGHQELSEVERFYESEINHKISLVRSQLDDPSILADLEAMDNAFAELKADLREDVDNEEVVLAMMQNYQLKLKILEEILLALEQEHVEKGL